MIWAISTSSTGPSTAVTCSRVRAMAFRPALRVRRFGNAADRLAGGVGTIGKRDVAERYDADEPFALVDDRQPPHLHVAHVVRDVSDIVILGAIEYLAAHHFAHRRIGTEPRCDCSH